MTLRATRSIPWLLLAAACVAPTDPDPIGADRQPSGVTSLPAESVARCRALLDEARSAAALDDNSAAQSRIGEAIDLVTIDTLGRGGEEAEALVLELAGVAEELQAVPALIAARRWVCERRQARLPPDHHDLLQSMADLAFALSLTGDVRSATELDKQVLEGRRRTLPADHPDLLKAIGNYGLDLRDLGDLVGARHLFGEVVIGFERVLPPDHPDLLRARGNLAIVLFEMGDLAAARALEERILETKERHRGDYSGEDLLVGRLNLAVTKAEMGDPAGAIAILERAIEEGARALAPEHQHLLRARYNLAGLLFLLGNTMAAREISSANLRTLERTRPPGDPLVLQEQNLLANVLVRQGNLEAALELCQSAADTTARSLPEDHPARLNALLQLGDVLGRAGQLARARTMIETVVHARDRMLPADDRNRLHSRQVLLRILHALHDEGAIAAELPLLVRGIRLRVDSSLLLSPREALAALQSEAARLSLCLWLTDASGARAAQAVEVFELIEAARTVVATAQGISGVAARGDDSLLLMRREAAVMRASLNDLVAGGPSEPSAIEEWKREVQGLVLEIDRAESALRAALSDRDCLLVPIRAADIAAVLAPDEAAVGYWRREAFDHDDAAGSDRSAARLIAHVVTRNRPLIRLDLGPAVEIEGLVAALRAAAGTPIGTARSPGLTPRGSDLPTSEVDALGVRLRRCVLDPVLEAAGSVRTLRVCLDDALELMPLDALPLDTGRVGDGVSILVGTCFADWATQRPAVASRPSLLAIGGVDYDAAPGDSVESLAGAATPPIAAAGPSEATRRFSRLSETVAEMESVVDLHKRAWGGSAAVLAGAAATKAALFARAPGSRFVHIATHGWFAPETVPTGTSGPQIAGVGLRGARETVTALAPMTLCGLAFAGANRGRDARYRVPGIMTAEELCSLDLSDCELVVLSACETSAGVHRSGQGMQSLRAALHAAGARTAITSLWKVDDAATRQLMSLFYEGLWINKQSKAQALWHAKRALRESGHPIRDWAAWVLTGDPQ